VFALIFKAFSYGLEVLNMKKINNKLRMKKELINKSVGLILGMVVLSTLVPVVGATGMAQFNTASYDGNAVEVSNYTRYPGSNTNWATTVNADPSDVLSFLIYYHNTSSVTARNTKLKLNLSPNVSNSSPITAIITADNAYTAGGGVVIYLNYGSNVPLTLVSGSAKWYTGSNSTLTTIPYGQSGNEVVTSSTGLRIGDVLPGNAGYLVVRAQLGGYTQNNPNPQGNTPSVFTNSSSNTSTSSATLHGSVNPNNSSTTAWFEYGPTQSLGYTSSTFSIGSGSSQTSFSASVFNLSPNSTYYFRAVAQNGYGTARGSILSFTTQAEQQQQQGGAPFARTESYNNTSTTGATLLGAANPNGASTEAWFEYGISQSFGSSTTRQSVGSGSSYNSYNVSLSNLSQNTTYYFRSVAQNSFGTSQGTILSFTTQATQNTGGVPSVTTNSATSVSTASATLQASVNPNNSNTTGWFEYGTTTSLGSTTSTFSLGSGNTSTTLSSSLFNLSMNTTYYYRAVAQNSSGTSQGSILSFTTQNQQNTGGAPIVSTNAATGVSNNIATLNGSVNPNNANTTGWFEYGTTTSLGSTTSSFSLGSSNSSVTMSSGVFNLAINTTYYFRAVAQNSSGTSYGSILSFNSQGSSSNSAPFVSTSSASVLSANSATLYGSVNPNNSYTTGWFEYGPTASLGLTSSSFSFGSGNSSTTLYATISGLNQNSTYYYRAVAQNGYGTSYGSILSFSTGTTTTTVVNQTTDLSGIQFSLSQLSASLAGLIGRFGNSNNTNTTIIREVQVGGGVGGDLVKVTLTADKEALDPGDAVVLEIEVEPLANITEAVLSVRLGNGLEFDNTAAVNFTKTGDTITYNLGNISAGTVQVFRINAHLDSDFNREDGQNVVTSTATLNYSDASGNERTPVFASLDINIGGLGFFASIFGALPFGGVFTILLIALLILLVVIAIRKLLS